MIWLRCLHESLLECSFHVPVLRVLEHRWINDTRQREHVVMRKLSHKCPNGQWVRVRNSCTRYTDSPGSWLRRTRSWARTTLMGFIIWQVVLCSTTSFRISKLNTRSGTFSSAPGEAFFNHTQVEILTHYLLVLHDCTYTHTHTHASTHASTHFHTCFHHGSIGISLKIGQRAHTQLE